MQIGEMIHVVLNMLVHDRCPFCADPADQDTYTTYEGAQNNSGTLRTIMNDPSRLLSRQAGARPKTDDNSDGKQAQDDPDPSPNPIYSDNTTMYPGLSAVIGDYGDEAHHSISGNECMSGEAIEDIIKNNNGEYDGETGYSINNAANGVYLPSWSRARWGSNRPDGRWAALDDDLKYEIMRAAMRNGAGQAHIGSHDGQTTTAHPRSYPEHVKGKLDDITERVSRIERNCPETKENGAQKDPLPTPYGVNQWLDTLSRSISAHLKSHPRAWKYFVSGYAVRYHENLCRHGTLREILPDNWPPI